MRCQSPYLWLSQCRSFHPSKTPSWLQPWTQCFPWLHHDFNAAKHTAHPLLGICWFSYRKKLQHPKSSAVNGKTGRYRSVSNWSNKKTNRVSWGPFRLVKQKRWVLQFFIPERMAVFILLKVEGYVSLTPTFLGYNTFYILIVSSLARLGTGKLKTFCITYIFMHRETLLKERFKLTKALTLICQWRSYNFIYLFVLKDYVRGSLKILSLELQVARKNNVFLQADRPWGKEEGW